MEDSLNIFGEILVFSSEIHICFILFGLAEQHVDENKQVERLQRFFFFFLVFLPPISLFSLTSSVSYLGLRFLQLF